MELLPGQWSGCSTLEVEGSEKSTFNFEYTKCRDAQLLPCHKRGNDTSYPCLDILDRHYGPNPMVSMINHCYRQPVCYPCSRFSTLVHLSTVRLYGNIAAKSIPDNSAVHSNAGHICIHWYLLHAWTEYVQIWDLPRIFHWLVLQYTSLPCWLCMFDYQAKIS